jgi:hypothetical protein
VNDWLVPHVVVPPPAKPSAHTTITVSPVLPATEPASEWSELATCVGEQAIASHEAALSVPAVQALEPDATKPGSQVGWHDAPLSSASPQSPTPPLAGAALASHGFGPQRAAASAPAQQLVAPETVKPLSHVG